MRMYDVIDQKRRRGTLSAEAIRFAVEGFTRGDIPDCEMSALLMAICLNGMDETETAALTLCMADSGARMDLSSVPGVKVDKHSSGGVGDKTTLIAAPIAAACGAVVAKMSGRALGATGGTIDKLEAIPGYRTTLARDEFLSVVRHVGVSVIGQSEQLAPADKRLYALRDQTATVESIPLIASSIMSKKLAAGADAIVLDVKAGSGAFMKTAEDASALARAMVAIGENNGRRTVALITDMDRPLGLAIGTALEVEEAAATLRGSGPADLTALCLELAAHMLALSGKGDVAVCRQAARAAIDSGKAFAKLCAMVEAHGGDSSVLEGTGRFPQAAIRQEVAARQDGYITAMQSERIGMAALALGAGRAVKGDTIDPSAGIILRKKTGDAVRRGEPVAILHTNDTQRLRAGGELFEAALSYGDAPVPSRPLVHAVIGL